MNGFKYASCLVHYMCLTCVWGSQAEKSCTFSALQGSGDRGSQAEYVVVHCSALQGSGDRGRQAEWLVYDMCMTCV